MSFQTKLIVGALLFATQFAFADETVGIVTGEVRYVSDPQRPWRYARYYVRGGGQGPLAEAVVVLTAKGAEPAPETKLPPAKTAKTHVMDQREFRFVPETLAIRRGDQVKFTNADGVTHNVMTFDGDDPFNMNTAAGEHYTHRFKQAGGIRKPFRIGCVYHSQMRAWVYVFGEPLFHVTGEDGRFRWQAPPGEYELELVHPAGRLQFKQAIVVKANETTEVAITLTPDHVPMSK